MPFDELLGLAVVNWPQPQQHINWMCVCVCFEIVFQLNALVCLTAPPPSLSSGNVHRADLALINRIYSNPIGCGFISWRRVVHESRSRAQAARALCSSPNLHNTLHASRCIYICGLMRSFGAVAVRPGRNKDIYRLRCRCRLSHLSGTLLRCAYAKTHTHTTRTHNCTCGGSFGRNHF